MIRGSRRSSIWRVACATVLVLGAITLPTSVATAAPSHALLVAGVKIPGTDTPTYGSGDDRLVLNTWAMSRLGVYGITVDGQPARGLSVAWRGSDRHRSPSATDLVQLPNATNSALLDYLLWQHSGTTDPVQAAALHLAVWHLVGTGPNPTTWPPQVHFPSDNTPPVDAAGGGPLVTNGDPLLEDVIEQRAVELVSSSADFFGPWTLDITLSWATKTGTVSVRSANNTPLPGVTVVLNSFDATVVPSVVTAANGDATFGFTSLGSEATITASTTGPGVHTEHDIQGEADNSGFQRVAVGRAQTMTDSFTVKEPIISSFAKDAIDGDKVVGAGGSIIDTLQYQNLSPGGTYTTQVIWYYQDTGTPSSLNATKTFTASPTGSGSVDVGPLQTGATELGRSLVAFQFLFAGPAVSGVPEVIHANINDTGQSVTVQSLQLITAARDTFDGDRTAYAGATVMDTIFYIGLAPGVEFTAQLEWHYTNGTVSLGSTGLTASKTFFADANGFGTVDVGPVTLGPEQTGQRIVAFERLYIGSTPTGLPLGTHENADATDQSIDVLPPNIFTVAEDVADGDKTVQALGDVRDNLIYANLHPGVTYTARLEWHRTDGITDFGPTGLSATATFTPVVPNGGIVVGPVHLSSSVSGQRLVAFQRLYLGSTATGTPVAIHEQVSDPSQTINVLNQTIFTNASEGTSQGVPIAGDKEIVVGSAATIVDVVNFNAVVGAAIVVTGQLVRHENGVCSEPVATVTFSTSVPANHTLSVVYPLPEAPGEYVSYIIIRTPAGNTVAEHVDCLSETQRVTLVGGDLPETR